MQIKTMCQRYIVPFTVKDFAEAAARLDSRRVGSLFGQDSPESGSCWEESRPDGRTESDLYAYVREEFAFPMDDSSQTREEAMRVRAGFSWRRVQESRGSRKWSIKRLQFVEKDLTTVLYDVHITDMGIYLFRSGLGFVWYELELRNPGSGAKGRKRELSPEEIISFQFLVKELNRGGVSCFWENDWANQRRVPFSFGQWLARELAFLDPVFLPDRKNAYRMQWITTMKKAKKEGISLTAESRPGPETAGTAASKDTPGEKTWTFVCPQTEIVRVPDKALLFSYYALEEDADRPSSGEERQDLAYHLANGYKDAYRSGRELFRQMKQPAENILWYATRQGSAVLAWADERNRAFFEETFVQRFRGDYFTMYMKCLYQSWSLLLFGQRIQETLSCDPEDYLQAAEKEGEGEQISRLTRLICEISLFLSKSMATSVSHIEQQNMYYLYLKEQLHIEEDVGSVTAGLTALDNLQKEHRRLNQEHQQKKRDEDDRRRDEEEQERDEKVETILSLVSLLAIASALVDCYDFIGKFFPETEHWKDIPKPSLPMFVYLVFLLIIAGIGVYALVTVVKYTRERRKKKDATPDE